MLKRLRHFGLLLAISATACGSPGSPSADRLLVTWRTTDGSTFRSVIEGQEQVDRIREALESDGRAGIPNGVLRPGDGAVNEGHQWHLEDVELADVAIELCDGTASMVDEDLDYWLNTVRRSCPWEAVALAAEPLPAG